MPEDPFLTFGFDLILIIVPTVAGAIMSKILTGSWQKRKEIVEMKKSIISKLDLSLHEHNMDLRFFVSEVAKQYFDRSSEKYIPEKDKMEYTSTKPLPKKISEMPEQKFADEFKKLMKRDLETHKNYGIFISDLRLYYNHEQLSSKAIGYYRKEWKNLLKEFEDFMTSKNHKEFNEHYDKFFEKSKDLGDKLIKFRLELIETQMESMPV